jgi:hypothetical protein
MGNSQNFNNSLPQLNIDYKAVAQSVNITDVFQRYANVDLSKAKTGNVSCPSPNHSDKRPSAKIYHQTNTCHCFGCGQTWNSLSLYAELTNQNLKGNSDFPQIVERFADEFGVDWKSPQYSNYQEREEIKQHLYGRSSEPYFYDKFVLTSTQDMELFGLYNDRINGLVLSEEWKSNKTDVEEGLFAMIENKFQELSSMLSDTLDIIVAYENNFNVKKEKGIKEEYNGGMRSLLENPNYWINTTQLHERVENKVKNDVAEKFNIKPEEIKSRINNYNNYINQFEVAKKTTQDILRCYILSNGLVNNCMLRENNCNQKHQQYEGLDIKNIKDLSADILYDAQARHYQRFNFTKDLGFKLTKGDIYVGISDKEKAEEVDLGFEKIIQECKEREMHEHEEVSTMEVESEVEEYENEYDR